MELLYLFIKSFLSSLHCGCMFLKKDFLYTEAVKNLNLDTFSLLWNEILTSSKHCLCIICVYSEVLIPALSLFVIRVNYHCKNSFCCCGFRKTCAIKHNPFHIFCCVLSYIYHALYFLISMS